MAALALLLIAPMLLVASLPFAAHERGSQEIPASVLALTTPSIQTSPNREHILIGQEVTFYVNASSTVVEATLTITIYYDYFLADGSVNPDSPVEVVTTGNPGNVVTHFTYDSVGNCTVLPYEDPNPYYVVRAVVSDGVSTDKAGSLQLWVYDNTAPYFYMAPDAVISPDWGEEVEISFSAADFDDDPLDVVWDFGDGTPLAYDSAETSAYPVTFSQTHAWSPAVDPGSTSTVYVCWLQISVSDDQGNELEALVEIDVILNRNFSPNGTMSIEKTLVDPTEEIDIYASVVDSEGDAITWTYEIINDTQVVAVYVRHTEQTAPNTTVWSNITHVFGAFGNYTVKLYYTDAIDPALQVGAHNKTVSVSGIVCKNNTLPYVLSRIIATPENPWLSEVTWSAEVRLYLEIADTDGDAVTLVWDFGDGSPTVSNASADGSFTQCVQLHNYTRAGSYNVTATATDGWYGHEVVVWRYINVSSNNSAPTIIEFLTLHTNDSWSLPNTPVGFVVVFFDRDKDPINLTIEFGDGSDRLTYYLEDFNETGCIQITFNHSYARVGDYIMWMNFTDNQFSLTPHDASWQALVKIDEEVHRVPRIWDVWDYVGLGLLLGAVVSMMTWGILGVRKRKVLDRMGITWEEYLMRKKDESFDLKAREGEGSDGGGPR